MVTISEAAKSFVGTRFLHQGRDPASGLDCVGVWVAALRKAGFAVRDSRCYARFPCGRTLLAKASEQFSEVSVKHAVAGDMLVIRVPRSKLARHVGVYVGDGMMVHSEARRGFVALDRVDWSAVDAVFRVKGQADG